VADERFKQRALELGKAMALEGDAVQTAADEIETALHKERVLKTTPPYNDLE
jgi:hypothetical protein